MADVITRFKLETTQYESKLRDSSKALAAVSKQAELAGNDFAKFTQNSVEAAKALGNTAVGATNAKDKVKELVDAYNQVAKAYNILTDEQKKSDFGKAMAQSLGQLQDRIKEAKAEMTDTGGVLGQLKDKFTINIDALKVFQFGLSAVSKALDVAKDAFFANEQNLDEWGQIVESSESLYKGFLNALNTGDISGYLQNIGRITQAARDAYNALDELGTFNAFNQINVEKTRTGMTNAIVNFKEGSGSKEAVKAAGDAYKKELQERQKLEKEAYLAKVREVAAQRGVSGDDLVKALSGSYGSYQSLKALPLSGRETRWTPGGMFGGSTSYEVEVPLNRQEKLGQALRALNDTELQSLQALGAQAERTANEIASTDKQLQKILLKPEGGGGGGSKGTKGGKSTSTTPKVEMTEMQQNQKKINDLTQEYVNISGTSTDEIKARQVEIRKEIELLTERNNTLKLYQQQAQGKLLGGKVQTDGLGTLTDYRSIEFKGLNVKTDNTQKGIDNLTKSLTEQQKAWQLSSAAATAFGAALAGIEDPGVKAAGMVAQAVASIALGFAQASATASTAGTGWGWLAWLAAGASAMGTAIATIHSMTGYADGGIVKGNSYSGDNIPADNFVNAGELILSRSQQNNIAGQLNGNGIQNVNFEGVVRGENIWIVANRYTKRTGQGEIVTW